MKSEEWPQVGDEILICENTHLQELHRFNGKRCKVIGICKNGDVKVLTLYHKGCGLAALNMGPWLEKPPAPEEELADIISKWNGLKHPSISHSRMAKAIISGEIEGLEYKPE